VTNADVMNATGKLSGLPAWLQSAIQSLKSWWSSPADAGATVEIWGNVTPGGTQPASATVSVKSKIHVIPHAKATPAPAPIVRPWHTFAATRRRR
jgi:hypothetical protein